MAASVANLRLFVLTMVGSYTPAWRLSLGLPFTRSRPILQHNTSIQILHVLHNTISSPNMWDKDWTQENIFKVHFAPSKIICFIKLVQYPEKFSICVTLLYFTFTTGAVRQDSPLEILAFRINLSFIVEGPKLGHQIGGVLCCVHSQRLGDDQERSSKLGNSQLLSGTLRKQKCWVIFQQWGNWGATNTMLMPNKLQIPNSCMLKKETRFS